MTQVRLEVTPKDQPGTNPRQFQSTLPIKIEEFPSHPIVAPQVLGYTASGSQASSSQSHNLWQHNHSRRIRPFLRFFHPIKPV